ncbi:ribosome-associated heat shock protein Hsp15 [Apibacter mensalis]|jgi:ribosome-associated heat shock protein Hsp15|uniref:Ribosome-associated heat shock protein Hsp15 n=1 Tax=Apibacter mensalis TaxID=1586267 RepID=A0A0X3AMJ3_9FLAO|nr:S4 domain-containing protein [Apibacter mensalis]CVK15611.1 ribosome-associated heat shock protein Hsp15 [Apibacter mensalis]
MRIDKFLWCVRFYKTRAIATEECKKNRVFLDDTPLKPSREVLVGETYKIKKNQIDYKIQVIQIPPNRVGAKLVPLYIKDLTDPEQIEMMKTRTQTQNYYRQKGLGRPTKKDRRELDDYTLEWEDE